MILRAGRIVLAALATEVVAILALVALVALFGPHEKVAAQQFAERVGFWFGPTAGFVLCVAAAFWLARRLVSGQVSQGVFLGLAAAVIDIALLLLSAAPFQPVFFLSNVGRVLAGALGGWLASKRQPSAA